MSADADRRVMLIALAGAGAISFAPLLYSLSAPNPATGAFFRMAYAVPILALMVYFSTKGDTRDTQSKRLAFAAGLLLAFDFLGYHLSLIHI